MTYHSPIGYLGDASDPMVPMRCDAVSAVLQQRGYPADPTATCTEQLAQMLNCAAGEGAASRARVYQDGTMTEIPRSIWDRVMSQAQQAPGTRECGSEEDPTLEEKLPLILGLSGAAVGGILLVGGMLIYLGTKGRSR